LLRSHEQTLFKKGHWELLLSAHQLYVLMIAPADDLSQVNGCLSYLKMGTKNNMSHPERTFGMAHDQPVFR